MDDVGVQEFVNGIIEENCWFRLYNLHKFDEVERRTIIRQINQLILDDYQTIRYRKIYEVLGCAIELDMNELIDTILSLPQDYTEPCYPEDQEDYLRQAIVDGNMELFNKIVESITIRNKKRKDNE